MRAVRHLGTTRQLIAPVDEAGLGPCVGSQPRLDRTVLGDGETSSEQHVTQHLAGTVDLEIDRTEARVCAMSQPSLDDMRHPVGYCVGEAHRIERDTEWRVSGDGCSDGAAIVAEPEQLRRDSVTPTPASAAPESSLRISDSAAIRSSARTARRATAYRSRSASRPSAIT